MRKVYVVTLTSFRDVWRYITVKATFAEAEKFIQENYPKLWGEEVLNEGNGEYYRLDHNGQRSIVSIRTETIKRRRHIFW